MTVFQEGVDEEEEELVLAGPLESEMQVEAPVLLQAKMIMAR